jgi:hypothetical protein
MIVGIWIISCVACLLFGLEMGYRQALLEVGKGFVKDYQKLKTK